MTASQASAAVHSCGSPPRTAVRAAAPPREHEISATVPPAMIQRSSSVSLLELDPDLGQALAPDDLEAARRDLVVPARTLDRGPWEPLDELQQDERWMGVLVLDGLLLRDIVVAGTSCAELVGEGDILRPWDNFGGQAPMPYEISWETLEPARIAILDRRASEVIGRHPELATAIVTRAVARAHALALSLAVTCITGVKIRLLIVLWHLADRWGKVTPRGVVVPHRLTHETLGKLVGARRPSVSTALGELQDGGLVEISGDGMTLHGDPPEEVRQMQDRRRMASQMQASG